MNDRTLQLLRRTQLLRLLPLSAKRTIGGRNWHVPLTHHTGWSLLHDDMPYMSEVLRRALPLFPGPVVESLASSGHFLLHVKAVDADRHVMLFAPQPACLTHLRRLAGMNRMAHVHIVDAMLAEASGSSPLHVFTGPGCDDTATLEPSWKFGFPAYRAVPVRTVSLDNHVMDQVTHGRMPAPGLVRIHARGAESRVLAGMSGVLRASRPLLCIQWPPVFRWEPPEHLHGQEAAEQLLHAHDYVLLQIRYDHLPLSLEPINGPIGLQPDHGQCTHLAVHRSRAAEIMSAF
ncbi:MAG: FkbM family methyltransferase [Flavobacteriales bacterium]|nr:FkbM family methyltransferase [Flavobacteriales bacterium]